MRKQLSRFNTVQLDVIWFWYWQSGCREEASQLRDESGGKCQLLPKYLFTGLTEKSNKYSSATIRQLHQQRPSERSYQPIYQPLALKAFLTPSAHQGLASKKKKKILDSREESNVTFSLTLTTEKQWSETKKANAATVLLLAQIWHKTVFASSSTLYW